MAARRSCAAAPPWSGGGAAASMMATAGCGAEQTSRDFTPVVAAVRSDESFSRASGARKCDLESPNGRKPHEMLVRLLHPADRVDRQKSHMKYGKSCGSSRLAAPLTRWHRGYRGRNRTVRATIPPLVWKTGSQGKNHSGEHVQPAPTSVIRESVWRFSQRQMSCILPGGGLM